MKRYIAFAVLVVALICTPTASANSNVSVLGEVTDNASYRATIYISPAYPIQGEAVHGYVDVVTANGAQVYEVVINKKVVKPGEWVTINKAAVSQETLKVSVNVKGKNNYLQGSGTFTVAAAATGTTASDPSKTGTNNKDIDAKRDQGQVNTGATTTGTGSQPSSAGDATPATASEIKPSSGQVGQSETKPSETTEDWSADNKEYLRKIVQAINDRAPGGTNSVAVALALLLGVSVWSPSPSPTGGRYPDLRRSDTPKAPGEAAGRLEKARLEPQAPQTNQVTALGEQLVEYAKNFLGIPYVLGGDGYSSTDCGLSTEMWYEECGIDLGTRRADYQAALFQQYGAFNTGFNADKLKPGDLLFFDNTSSQADDADCHQRITHVGMYIGDGQFIHASSAYGGVVICELSGYYVDHLAGSGDLNRLMQNVA